MFSTWSGRIPGLAFHKRKFNDKVQDDLTALTYYGARYYDKTLIGWTQGDPMFRFAPDSAWTSPRRAACYMFSGQNPLRYIDPDGRDFGREVMRLAYAAAPTEFADPGPAGPVESGIDRGLNMLAAASNPISSAVASATGRGIMDSINDAAVSAMVPPAGGPNFEIPLEGRSPQSGGGGGTGAPPAGGGVGEGGPAKQLAAPKERGSGTRQAPPERGTFFVDPVGNAYPSPPGGRLVGKKDNSFMQVVDAKGKPTGVRKDGPHEQNTDPKAQVPHGHQPGAVDEAGNTHLKIRQ